MERSDMSRKSFSAGMAIAAISSSNDWKTQAAIAVVAIVAIFVQGYLDYRENK